MKKYEITVTDDKIIVTGSIPVMDMMPITVFAEKKLGKNCLMDSHPDKVDGFSIVRAL